MAYVNIKEEMSKIKEEPEQTKEEQHLPEKYSIIGLCHWCRENINNNHNYKIYKEKFLFHNPDCYLKFLENEIVDKEKEIEILNEWFVDGVKK